MEKKTLSIYDLMIGDIVIAEEYYLDEDTDEEVYNDHPFKIEGVSKSDSIYIDGEECRYEGNWMDGCQCETVGDIYPMPLTKEILEANGIRYQYGSPWWQKAYPYGNTDKFEVHINEVTTVIVEYVHELQHALRLCGLREMADNFKIE